MGLMSLAHFTFADEPAALIHHRVDTNVIIPEKIELDGLVSIPAVIGETFQSPIIKVMINDQGPFLFGLDTGFSDSIISKKLVDQLKLTIIQKTQIKYETPNQTMNEAENTVLIKKIQIGNMTILNYGMYGSSSAKQDELKFQKLHIDGLISINMFHGVLLTLDYKNEMLRVQSGELSSSDKEIVPYQKGYSVPVIETHIQLGEFGKESPYNFMLDTGDPTNIYINTCTLPVKPFLQDQDMFMQYDIFGYPAEVYIAQLNGSIKLSESVLIKSPHVSFSDSNCGKSPAVGRFGRKFFEQHETTFDNKNGLVKLR